MLTQLPELLPSALAGLSRGLIAWDFLPSARWLGAYWQAVEQAAGSMYAEGLQQVRGCAEGPLCYAGPAH
jgi:hypothetical protein